MAWFISRDESGLLRVEYRECVGRWNSMMLMLKRNSEPHRALVLRLQGD